MTQLSSQTIAILQNFAAINQNLLVDPDKPLGTISATKSIIAQADIEDTFPVEFGIYDLNEFLTAINLVGADAELDFGDKSVKIAGNGSRIEYFFSRAETLNVTLRSVKMPSEDATFTLTQEVLNSLKKASSVFGHKKVLISDADGAITARVADPANPTASSFTQTIEGDASDDGSFSFTLDIDNLKLFPGDYAVTYASAGIVQFVNTTQPIRYWVAVEK
jgi:hypothetical protein